MRIVLTGATGTIGGAFARVLVGRGDQVIALTRDLDRGRQRLGEGIELHRWPDPATSPPPAVALTGADAVLHLMGEPVAQRWNEQAKKQIRDSRVAATRMLVAGLRELPEGERPRVLISQSATGYYGPRGDERLVEDASPGDDFLADVVLAWERAAEAAGDLLRVVRMRTGIVLAPRGGALAQMLPFFRLGLGGPVAGGRQYMPWVHLDDVVGAMLECVASERADGAFNLTAPEPVTNAEFSKALGRALGRPAVLPVPGFGLRLLYGEMSVIVTTGQRVVPDRLLELGYKFRFEQVEPALRDVLG